MVIDLMMGGDLETAQGIIDAAGVTLPKGDLISGAYDEAGNFYQMPESIISDPVNVVPESLDAVGRDAKAEEVEDIDEEEAERRREEKGKGVLKSGDMIKIKARLSDRGGPDVQILLGKDQNVRILARRVQEEIGVRHRIPNRSTSSILTAASAGRQREDKDCIPRQSPERGGAITSSGLEGRSCGQCTGLPA